MSPDDLTLADAVEWRPVFRHKPRPVKRGGSAISLVWPDWGFGGGGTVDAPAAGDAFEFPLAAVFEEEPGAGDEILDRL
jgi:hypothetical protein